MLEKSDGEIKNGQSRETGSIGYTRWRKTKHFCLFFDKQKLQIRYV